MKSDYLWDGSGEPDPELQKLERALGQFRARAEAPDFSVTSASPTERGRDFAHRNFAQGWTWPRWVAASVLGAGVAAGAAVLFVHAPTRPGAPGWEVARIEGTPVVGSTEVASENQKASLRVGEVLMTDKVSSATVQVAGIGELYVDPGSRIKLLETGSKRKRVSVEIGTIHAAIWAPPGEFVVDTPSATAVDLGCAYSLTVAEDGSGMLRTQLGWVGFHRDGRDSFIPAGAMCLTHSKTGPGTPYFEDATEKFRNALHALDFATLNAQERREELQTVISQARQQDAFTLWHLLPRVSESERPMVYERMAALVPAPVDTTREGTLRLDATMLDKWWNAFALGDISIWRFWEQNEAPHGKKSAG